MNRFERGSIPQFAPPDCLLQPPEEVVAYWNASEASRHAADNLRRMLVSNWPESEEISLKQARSEADMIVSDYHSNLYEHSEISDPSLKTQVIEKTLDVLKRFGDQEERKDKAGYTIPSVILSPWLKLPSKPNELFRVGLVGHDGNNKNDFKLRLQAIDKIYRLRNPKRHNTVALRNYQDELLILASYKSADTNISSVEVALTNERLSKFFQAAVWLEQIGEHGKLAKSEYDTFISN